MTPVDASKEKIKELFILIYMVIWSYYHLNQNSKLVIKFEYLSIKENF